MDLTHFRGRVIDSESVSVDLPISVFCSPKNQRVCMTYTDILGVMRSTSRVESLTYLHMCSDAVVGRNRLRLQYIAILDCNLD